MLTMCFDGSGKGNDPASKYVTLAGFAGEEYAWDNLNTEWLAVLKDRGDAPCMHMADIVSASGDFKGWSQTKAEYLIFGLLGILQGATFKRHVYAIRITVSKAGYEAWREDLPTIPELCVQTSFARMLLWYSNSYPNAILPMKSIAALFDRNEPFMNVVMQSWNNKTLKQEQPYWSLMKRIIAVDGCDEPGIQAADMLAWSANRLLTRDNQDWGGKMAEQVIERLKHDHIELEELDMRAYCARVVL